MKQDLYRLKGAGLRYIQFDLNAQNLSASLFC